MELTPSQIVSELDRYIVGQDDAKKAVAIALRNRFRRSRLSPELREEVVPKNILMIGPTGVGKTEIARRLAKLANAPFIKVEATKFTEVGYVGRDVESIIRDLVESSIRIIKAEKMEGLQEKAYRAVDERIIDYFAPLPEKTSRANPFGALFGMTQMPDDDEDSNWQAKVEQSRDKRDRFRKLLELGELEKEIIEIDVQENKPQFLEVFSGNGMEDMGINIQDVLGGVLPKKKKKRKMPVSEARPILMQEEASKLLDEDAVTSEAISRTEENGIVFIDEIDKVAGGSRHDNSPDVSREGVQRDILPIVEGSTVVTKWGPVKTDHILFIAAGAFHTSKPSDLIPELQGRFPIRVELQSLKAKDLRRILTEPKAALVKQYVALMSTEGVELEFTEDAIEAIANIAERVNQRSENIGARRLHTILERLLEEISFNAEEIKGRVDIDSKYVKDRLDHICEDQDLSRFIL